jgi:transposase
VDAEDITVGSRRLVVVTHRGIKYRCRCNGCVKTAPGPLRLTARPDVRGRRYAPAFAVEVAVGKYLDHAPLERQARIMSREGLTIESQTLWDQIDALARVLQPTYEALRQHVLAAPVVGADETWWRLLTGAERPRWWAWSVTCADAVTYTILPTRSQDAARRVLGDYRGIVVADGYGAYEALARAGPGVTLAHCWAHVRRKFREAEPHYPAVCAEILGLIGQLYAAERTVPSAAERDADETARAAALARRAQVRRDQAGPIVAAIQAWAQQQRALPESSVGKAIAYMLGLWPGLTRFLADPRIPLDNNATERGLRGLVVGRKNHYGSRSQRGTEVAALFYSLIESAKLCGVEPKGYLLHATRTALTTPGTATLPHALLSP